MKCVGLYTPKTLEATISDFYGGFPQSFVRIPVGTVRTTWISKNSASYWSDDRKSSKKPLPIKHYKMGRETTISLHMRPTISTTTFEIN